MRIMDKMSTWLSTVLSSRAWSMRELARRAGVSHTQIGNVINGQAAPSADFCIAIARALQVSPEPVLRRAGLLPSLPPEVEEEREILAILRRLHAGVRRTVATMIRGLAGPAPNPAAVADPAVAYNADDILIPELLEEFRQVPDEWKETAIRQIAELRRAGKPPAPRIIGEELETERNAENPQI